MDTVSQIKQKLDITDVVGSYLTLKKAGKNYKTTCPFHSEDSPSFMVSQELQIYKCFGCGEGGDMFTFVEKLEGVDFARALEILADKAGVVIEKDDFDPNHKKKKIVFDINDASVDFYHHLLVKHPVGKKGLEYLTEKRKLDLETINVFKLGYAPDNWDTLFQYLLKKGFSKEDLEQSGTVVPKRSNDGFIDKFRGRIMFPLIDISGKTVGFTGRDVIGRDPKYLNSPETVIYNKSAYLYGLDKAKVAVKKEGVVFVEGQMDVIKAYQNGIHNVVASSGTALTATQLRIISRYTKEIVFSFDPDEAGMLATTRAVELTNQFDFEVKVVVVPEKYADLDEFISDDATEAKSVLKNPIPIYDFYLVRALKLFDKDSAYGKKKIVEFLSPLYSRISNAVVSNHYIKALSEKIDVTEDAIREAFTKDSRDVSSREKPGKDSSTNSAEKYEAQIKGSSEEYLLALLSKVPIDTIGSYVYKLEPQDFVSERNKYLYSEIKKYIDSTPAEFDIKYFTDVLKEGYKEAFLEMYLWDFGGMSSDQELLAKEMNATISRLKKETTKRKLKNLSEQVKLAEMEKNTKLVKELSEQIKELSETLI